MQRKALLVVSSQWASSTLGRSEACNVAVVSRLCEDLPRVWASDESWRPVAGLLYWSDPSQALHLGGTAPVQLTLTEMRMANVQSGMRLANVQSRLRSSSGLDSPGPAGWRVAPQKR